VTEFLPVNTEINSKSYYCCPLFLHTQVFFYGRTAFSAGTTVTFHLNATIYNHLKLRQNPQSAIKIRYAFQYKLALDDLLLSS